MKECMWQSVNDDMTVLCTACGKEFSLIDLQNVATGETEDLPNYCPHCGAKTTYPE